LLQNEVFFDPEVRFLGNQLACVKLDVSENADVLTEYKVKSTPALVVLDKTGKAKKTFEGKIKASKVARTLRSVAPQKSPPKR
jgi:thioredoxin-like negative regulator of GroEL